MVLASSGAEMRDAPQRPTTHMTASRNRDLPKTSKCRCREAPTLENDSLDLSLAAKPTQCIWGIRNGGRHGSDQACTQSPGLINADAETGGRPIMNTAF